MIDASKNRKYRTIRIPKKARTGKTEEQPNALPAGSAKAVPIEVKIMTKQIFLQTKIRFSLADLREEQARGGRDQRERFRTQVRNGPEPAARACAFSEEHSVRTGWSSNSFRGVAKEIFG